MKNLSIIIFVSMVVVVLGVFFVSFQVRDTEVALVTRFGDPIRPITEPGWYWKLPKPIDDVYKFDSRNHYFEIAMEEPTTKSGEPIVVTTYAIWQIEDPQKYFDAVENEKGAREKLKSLLRDTQNTVIGQYYWSEFVNSDPSKIRLSEIERKMEEVARSKAKEDYGIGIERVGLKQLGVSEKVTKEVFERMKADRGKRTTAILADGDSLAGKIKADAEAKKTELLAIVEAEAKSIKGAGDAEAAKYYKMLEADPDLAMFLRDIEALKQILKDKSTIILGAETEPIELLKGIPDITPK